MRALKRLLAILLAVCFFLGQVALSEDETAEKRLESGLSHMDLSIKLDDYALTRSEFSILFQHAVGQSEWLSRLCNGYTLEMDGDIVSSVTPVYNQDEIKQQSEEEQVKMAIRKIIAECITPGMTQAQKALAVSDYFCTHFVYSMENGVGAHNYALLLLTGKGVCQAYADAYTKVMQALGMKCYTVTCAQISHAWNMIVVDGKWYHVDTTWNDRYNSQTDDAFGYARHDNLLLSNDAIQATGHPLPDNAPVGSDVTGTAYDQCFWRDLDSPVCQTKDAYYYARALEGTEYGIMKRGLEANASETCVKRVDCARKEGGRTCMGVVVRGDRVYYNTATQVRSCTLTGADDRLEVEPRLYAGETVSRVYVSGQELQYGMGTDCNLPVRSGTLTLPARTPVTELRIEERLQFQTNTSGCMLAEILPNDASNCALKWYSDDSTVLEIDENTGRYKALKDGTATVKVCAQDGSNVYAECYVTVSNLTLALNQETLTLYTLDASLTQSYTLKAILEPDPYHTESVTWTSSRPDVVSVSEGGVVTAMKVGQAKVTARHSSGLPASCKVNVVKVNGLVTLPLALDSVPDKAFFGDEAIEAVRIPDGVSSIGKQAFAGCTNLHLIVIPSSVTVIADDAFNKNALLCVFCKEDSTAWQYATTRGYTVRVLP